MIVIIIMMIAVDKWDNHNGGDSDNENISYVDDIILFMVIMAAA